jgi:hypothetical protein
VPLTYRHKTATHDVLVRLAGVHTKADLEKLAEKIAAPPEDQKKQDKKD